MTKKRKHCHCRFWQWLINKALKSAKIYWLLWGLLVILALGVWRFGWVGLAW